MNYSNEHWVCSEKRPSKKSGYAGTPGDPEPIVGAKAFDDLIPLWINNPIRLHPGHYWTKGQWNRREKSGAVILRGSGTSDTRIGLDCTLKDMPTCTYPTGTLKRPDVPFFLLRGATSRLHEFRDLTLDATEAAKDPDLLPTNAIRIELAAAIVENVECVGMAGRYTAHPKTQLEYEAFVVSFAGTCGGAIVRNLTVRFGRKSAYGTGLSIGYLPGPGGYPAPSIAEDVRIISPGDNHASVIANTNVAVRRATCVGMRFGGYCDTDSLDNVSFRDCEWNVHTAAFWLVCHNQGETRKGFSADRCGVTFDPLLSTPCYVLGAILANKQVPPARFERIDIKCSVRNPSIPRPVYRVSSDVPDVRNAQVSAHNAPEAKTNLPNPTV